LQEQFKHVEGSFLRKEGGRKPQGSTVSGAAKGNNLWSNRLPLLITILEWLE
jgi:hypothetical protein